MIPAPSLLSISFLLITAITVYLFYLATNKDRLALILVITIAVLESALAFTGFYTSNTTSFPPRIGVMLLPAIILFVLAFFTRRGKEFISNINLLNYTYLHTIRVGVEFVILWLVIEKLMPNSMSFEGRNFDIFSGITAPLIAYYGFIKKKISTKIILVWNIVCLFLVLQVVITGIFSAPSAIQQLSFDQPNFAVLYFPLVLLASIVVPIVIFGHMVSIRAFLKA